MTWELLYKVTGLFGIIGSIYLYFERMQFNKLDAERKLDIAISELNDLLRRRERRIEMARARRLIENDNMVTAMPYEENRNDDSLQEIRLEADIKYYRALVYHSFFWFIPKIIKKMKDF